MGILISGGIFLRKPIRLIAETGVLLALLVALQALTKPAGQLVTGSCVNLILALGAMLCGVWSGAALALISPFLAYLLGVGPQLFPIVPAIALGNVVYAALLARLCAGPALRPARRLAGAALAAAAKFLMLYLVIVRLLCSLLPLAPAQLAAFSVMFSWPQLFTALIGAGAALLLAPVLQKALRRS